MSSNMPLSMPSIEHPNIFQSLFAFLWHLDKKYCVCFCSYFHSCHCACVSGLTRSWKMYRLLVAAMAIIFSDGCQAMCRIFLVKSKLSTPTSPLRRLPPVYTRRVRSTARGLLLSRQASRVTPRPVSLSNIRKKLLYAPVIITLDHGGKERRKEVKSGKRQAVFTVEWRGGKEEKANWIHEDWFYVCKACLWDWFKRRIKQEAGHLGNHCKQ